MFYTVKTKQTTDFSFVRKTPIETPRIVRPTTYLEQRTDLNPPVKKIKWGEPFWNLFHVLSCKVIEDEQFVYKKNQLLNLIYIICQNLPCPDCASHATQYLNGINFAAIQSKEQLITMLFDFHNSVNLRRSVPFYSRADFDEKYPKGKTRDIIEVFLRAFENKHKSIHMMSNDFYRQGLAKRLKEWLTNNLSFFSM